MEMLNTMLLSGGFWSNIIDFFANAIVNYGWAIIVFTICLKLVLSPLDILQRTASQKQSRMMRVMQPELTALQEKYKNDKVKLNQETNNLYKKYKVNVGGMCITMLLTLVISMVVLFTLYSSIRSYGNEKLYTSYGDLETEYVQAEEYAEAQTDWTQEQKDEYITLEIRNSYDELKKQNSWLWIKNVWKSDTNVSQFVNFDDYADHMGLEGADRDLARTRYDYITGAIVGDGSDVNGYYVVIIFAVLISFLTQFLSAKLLAPKGQKLNMMNKVMMAVIPLTMLILALTSNVVFTLYIITNSLMSAIISTVITLIMRKIDKNKSDKEIIMQNRKIEVVEYSRNYKK